MRQTQLEATKRRLLLTKEEEEAQINQRLEIEKVRAASEAEAAKAREAAMIASEEARIERERQTRATEVAKQSELRKLEVESQLGLEMKKVDSAIQLAAKHVEEAKSQAQAELARTEVILRGGACADRARSRGRRPLARDSRSSASTYRARSSRPRRRPTPRCCCGGFAPNPRR